MPLKYAPFAASSAMEAAARSKPVLRRGSRGPAVALLQGALVDLGYKLPKSTRKHGAPDGLFGIETEVGLVSFQGSNELVADGIAGRRTIERLDSLMAKKAGAPLHTSPPAVPVPSSRDYKIGSGDPGHSHDPGAGIWNSKPTQATYMAMKASIYSSLPVAAVVIGDDAAKHMKHYLDNSGNALTIDLEGMVKEVPTAKERYEDEVAQARLFVESLEPGRHSITSIQAEVGYNTQKENRNWYFAIGGYSTWGRGTAVVTDGTNGREFQLDFEYRFYDRYNWDKGKSVTFAGITVTDHFMGEFHRQGLANEFDCTGAIQRQFSWKKGGLIPSGQLHPPPSGSR